MNKILKNLGITEISTGSCFGGESWNDNGSSNYIESYNPTNGELLGKIQLCDERDYEDIINKSNEAKEWKMVPAPIRGQLILEMANELRSKKDELGSLVSLEMGKIKAEGDGEVQEMIDILICGRFVKTIVWTYYAFRKA